jgi:hypothetical protein
MELFKPYDPTVDYAAPFIVGNNEDRWVANNIEQAIRSDRLDMLKDAIKRGWLKPTHRAFDNQHVVNYCDQRKAAQCAAHLRSLGWPEFAPEAA